MVDPLFQIGGIASGLDTTSIIQQLMQLERAPVRRYERSQQDLRAVDEAWSGIVSQLSAFRTALDDVRRTNSFSQLTTASSSNEGAVTVTDGDGGEVGSLSFTVSALAARHREGLDGAFGSVTSLVGAGTLTLTDETGGTLGTITTDSSTTLQGLADQIDDLGVGIEAQALKVSDGEYRLVLSATETGAAGQFSTSTDIASLGAVSTVSTGADAQLDVGGITVTRSSNTIDDLVAGATIELHETTTTDVTVSVEQDTTEAVDRVRALVEAANALFDQIADDTSYDSDTGRSGVLQGDALARELGFDLREAFAQTVGTGDIDYIGDIGISLTRDGRLELDETQLEEALTTNPSGVESFLSAGLSGDDGVQLTYVGTDAVDGGFTMSVSQAAAVASATGATYTPPSGSPKTFSVTTPEGETVDVTIDDGMSASQAVARINAALDAAGIGSMSAEVVDDGAGGDALHLSTLAYGSSTSFTISGYGVDLDGTHTGTDVVADFGSGAVTGSGQSLQGSDGADGLTLKVTGGTGAYDLAFSSGLGGVLDRFAESLEGVDGQIQRHRDSLDNRIRDYDDQIEAFEQRLELREQKLRQQFASLESAMGRLQAQGQWLSGALGSLGGGSLPTG